jgi:DNA invertase Pin-like site-specific DNA recombinase
LGIERTANVTAKRVATYLRVSTKLDTQRLAVEEYARNRGFEIVTEYADHGFSGSKDRRPELDRIMKDARARKFDAVLVARFDMFARAPNIS